MAALPTSHPTIFAQKAFAVLGIAKRFGTPSPRNRQRPNHVRKFQAILDLSSPNVLVNEARVETISRTNWIGYIGGWRKSRVLLLVRHRHRALCTTLNHQYRNFLCQHMRRALYFVRLRQLAASRSFGSRMSTYLNNS